MRKPFLRFACSDRNKGGILRILIIEDDASIRTVLSRALQSENFEVLRAERLRDGLNMIRREKPDAVISDVMLPDGNALDYLGGVHRQFGVPIIIISAQTNVLTAIRAGKSGAFEYLPKPFDVPTLIQTVHRAIQHKNNQTSRLQNVVDEKVPIVGRSSAMQSIFQMLGKVIQTDLTVLVMGESGTGKELVAKILHEHGPRTNKPFVAMNMAAIPSELIETELFGYEKGAFTGADEKRIGKFEQAEGGTLFLDEIGDMPEAAQTRLLRVLQEGEFVRVGGHKPVSSNVRIIAATHQDIRQLIAKRLFREDLFYRINVVPIQLPPLRDRSDDIPDLVEHFVLEGAKKNLPDKVFTPEALDLMKQYHWPGNIRELENTVHRLMVLKADRVLEPHHIMSALPDIFDIEDYKGVSVKPVQVDSIESLLRRYAQQIPDLDQETQLYQRLTKEFERPLFHIVLEHTRGNQLAAARILGINRNTLRKKLAELGIEARGEKL